MDQVDVKGPMIPGFLLVVVPGLQMATEVLLVVDFPEEVAEDLHHRTFDFKEEDHLQEEDHHLAGDHHQEEIICKEEGRRIPICRDEVHRCEVLVEEEWDALLWAVEEI